MIEPLVILLAFVAGLGFRKLGLPPLLGYLLAGFLAYGLGLGSGEAMAPLADLGILLLLFTIGLKLNIQELAAPQVWAVASLQMLVFIPLLALCLSGLMYLLPSLAVGDSNSLWVLAFALSFSSTVFAVKIFDERGEGNSFHASIAIGILVVQDIIAVVYLVLTSDKAPSPYAFALLLLPLLRPALLWLARWAGHGELLILFGLCVAVGTGALFESLHLKAGLGALVAGILLANSDKSAELYKSLLNFKDIFLIGFFLQIGYSGLPSIDMLLMALALCGVLLLRPLIYFALLVLFKLRARTALLTGFSLFNYSEFGLIVTVLAVQAGVLEMEWLTALALAMSISFFIAVPFNSKAHDVYGRFADIWHRFERRERLLKEKPIVLGEAKILILGMGRIGTGAYHYLNDLYTGAVVGVDENHKKQRLQAVKGLNCIQGDASDYDFWQQADLDKRALILICLTNHAENVAVVEQLKKQGYKGHMAVVSRFPDEERQLLKMGCIAFNLYAEAGHGFAEHIMEQMDMAEPRLEGELEQP